MAGDLPIHCVVEANGLRFAPLEPGQGPLALPLHGFPERCRPHGRDRDEVVRVPGGHLMHREHPEGFIGELRPVLKDLLV